MKVYEYVYVYVRFVYISETTTLFKNCQHLRGPCLATVSRQRFYWLLGYSLISCFSFVCLFCLPAFSLFMCPIVLCPFTPSAHLDPHACWPSHSVITCGLFHMPVTINATAVLPTQLELVTRALGRRRNSCSYLSSSTWIPHMALYFLSKTCTVCKRSHFSWM